MTKTCKEKRWITYEVTVELKPDSSNRIIKLKPYDDEIICSRHYTELNIL